MSELIGQAKMVTDMAKEKFLKTFSFVPDDKLNWTPAPTSKSCLRLAAHIAVSGHFMAAALRGEKMPYGSFEEMFAKIDEQEKSITTREAAVSAIEQSVVAVHAAQDSITPERLAGSIDMPGGHQMPMAAFVMLPGRHIFDHASQVDYIQTMWGDLENHF